MRVKWITQQCLLRLRCVHNTMGIVTGGVSVCCVVGIALYINEGSVVGSECALWMLPASTNADNNRLYLQNSIMDAVIAMTAHTRDVMANTSSVDIPPSTFSLPSKMGSASDWKITWFRLAKEAFLLDLNGLLDHLLWCQKNCDWINWRVEF